MRFNRSVAMILLAIYLILIGLQGLGVSFSGLDLIAALCALIAGILILIGR